jgi:hypothetical protein
VLWIFIAIKNPSPPLGKNPWIGSNEKHANRYTTEVTALGTYECEGNDTPYSVFEMGWQILRRTQPKWCSIVLLPLKNISLSSEQDLKTTVLNTRFKHNKTTVG